jgi:hypothetical protein
MAESRQGFPSVALMKAIVFQIANVAFRAREVRLARVRHAKSSFPRNPNRDTLG